MFGAYFADKECGGLFHAMSEDWSAVRDADKHADEQFNDARTQVIGAMLTHDPDAILDAQAAVDSVMARFEDPEFGGFFFMAEQDWRISKTEKSLGLTADIFGVLMHLYEVSKNDAYLLKALGFLDVALDKAWDQQRGGFFGLYHQNWRPAVDIKDLATQAVMLQHMNGAWKDGMDSPFGARAAHARPIGKNKIDIYGQSTGKSGAWQRRHRGSPDFSQRLFADREKPGDRGGVHPVTRLRKITKLHRSAHAVSARPHPQANQRHRDCDP